MTNNHIDKAALRLAVKSLLDSGLPASVVDRMMGAGASSLAGIVAEEQATERESATTAILRAVNSLDSTTLRAAFCWDHEDESAGRQFSIKLVERDGAAVAVIAERNRRVELGVKSANVLGDMLSDPAESINS